MALTSPDNIYYPDSTSQIAPLETHFATLANSVQTAFGSVVTYTPTLAGISIGNGSISAKSTRIGKVALDEIIITLGSTSTVSSDLIIYGLPVAGSSVNGLPVGTAFFRDNGITYYSAVPIINDANSIYVRAVNASGTYASGYTPINSTTPMTWAVGDQILVSIHRIIV